jgi:hypothetical protein
MLLFFACLTLGYGWRPSWVPPLHDTDCTFTRADSYECLRRYVDVNPKDDRITKTEVQEALKKHLPLYLRPLFWWSSSVDGIFTQCDYDKNEVITPRDWEMSNKTCMPIKESWCTVQWFCNRAMADKKKRTTNYFPMRPRTFPK